MDPSIDPRSRENARARFSTLTAPSLIVETEQTKLEKFYAYAVHAAASFRKKYQDRPDRKPAELKEPWRVTPEVATRLNTWVTSGGGASVIRKITQAAIDEVMAVVERGAATAGHDARHILYKDPAELLELLDTNESQSPYLDLAAPISVLHDIGRSTEAALGRVRSEVIPGDAHAKFGFVVLERIFNSIPRDERGEISHQDWELVKVISLDALLEHQSGHSRNSLLAQIVQSADRRWLVGAEFPTRCIPFCISRTGAKFFPDLPDTWKTGFPLPDSREDKSLLVHVLFFVSNLFPACDTAAQKMANNAKVISGTFVYLAASEEERKILFHPEITHYDEGVEYKKTGLRNLIGREIYEGIKKTAAEFECSLTPGDQTLERTVFEGLHQIMTSDLRHVPCHDNVEVTVWERILVELASLNDKQRSRLQKAFTYNNRCLEREERETVERLARSAGTEDPASARGILIKHVNGLLAHAKAPQF